MSDIILEATSTELNYSAGVTSPIQTQIDSIKNSLAAVEYEFVASRDYMTGEYFIYESQLYVVTTDVLTGTSFVDGTNVDTVDYGYFNSILSTETRQKWDLISPNTDGNLDKIISYLGDSVTFHKVIATSSIITASSAATIVTANYAQYGHVAQLYIAWKNKKAISVPASGNITNVQVGTIYSGKRPAIPSAAHSYGDNAGAAWYYIGSDGNLQLGACEGTGKARTIAANSDFRLCTTYIIP